MLRLRGGKLESPLRSVLYRGPVARFFADATDELIEEACERYTLTVDEFLSWQRSIDRYGLPGLRATRIQDYRD